MARFVVGDELGNIKLLTYNPSHEIQLKLTHKCDGPSRSVQKIAVHHDLITAAFSDGTCQLLQLSENDTSNVVASWKEDVIDQSKFIGMSNCNGAIFTCTSGGMLRRTPLVCDEGENPTKFEIGKQTHTTLPSQLCDWRLSEDGSNFAYGGYEVNPSLWDTDRAFQTTNTTGLNVPQSASKKRKKNEDLHPGELWRARNLPNDHLGLRDPIRITALAFLQHAQPGRHLITGTQFGDLRKYDTRAGRRPVSNWTNLTNVGGVKTLEQGFSEHQLFMSDGGSTLSSIDLRTGSILHRYRGISGAVISIAPSPTVIVSVSLDRFARVCSVVSPPPNIAQNQDHKPEVLQKCYLNSTPTVVAWDQKIIEATQKSNDDDEVWDNLEHIG